MHTVIINPRYYCSYHDCKKLSSFTLLCTQHTHMHAYALSLCLCLCLSLSLSLSLSHSHTQTHSHTHTHTHTLSSETSGVCSAHIINSGVTVTSERTVMIDWQATGPTLEKRVGNERLECTLFHLDTGMKDTYPSCTLIC